MIASLVASGVRDPEIVAQRAEFEQLKRSSGSILGALRTHQTDAVRLISCLEEEIDLRTRDPRTVRQTPSV